MVHTLTSSILTADSRRASLEAMAQTARPDAEPLDVLVIGGGVTGAGIALDAVTRGLNTAIVEAQDWSAGTSSRSSKLVHGGLRYLQMLDFHLVKEALTERDLLLKNLAPHLVRPVPFLYPLEHRVWERGYVGAGIALYDALATAAPGKRALPMHRHVTRRGMLRKFPDMEHDAAIGAIQYWDASVDDARLVVSLIRTAASYGAHAAPRTQVVELTKDSHGHINGAVIEDLETQTTHTVRARNVINATGVWTEETEALSGHEGGLHVLASKGIHIVVPRDRIRGEVGLILQTEKSVLFVIPWSRYWVIGTTDTPYDEGFQHPVVTATDIDYVLDHANAVLAEPITRADVVGTWAGLRPLLQPGTKEGTSSAKVSREHTVASPLPGLTVIAGGKLTTYRVMASDAVDFALGDRAKDLPSATKQVPLIGAAGLAAVQRQATGFGVKFGWTKGIVDHLLHRYGTHIRDLVALCQEHPDLAKPLENAPGYIRAEIVYAVTHEQALHLEDIIVHRTRIVYEYPNRGRDVLEEVAHLAAQWLGWDSETTEREIASYTARADAEDAAEREADDAAAARARSAAEDITPMRSVASAT